MQVAEGVKKMMICDYHNQNIRMLHDWSGRYRETTEIIELGLGGNILKQAIDGNKWLLMAYLLRVQNISQKSSQTMSGKDNHHPECALLLKSHLLCSDDSRMELLNVLHSRVRM